MSVQVTAAPIAFQPDRARIELTLPAGLTIAEMVLMALPGATEPVLERVRVALVKGDGMQIVPRALWHRARPHAGVHVVIRVIPGKSALNSILQILVVVAATAIAGFFAPAIAGALGITSQFGIGAVKGVLQLGLTALGGLLINALLPPPGSGKEEKPAYAITGWQNQFTPDAPVPVPMGTHRYAPPFGASSYIEVVGDVLYTRAAFLHGLGPLDISEEKLGDTLLTKFKDYELETRYGYPDDQPLSLYTNQVIEERIGTDLVLEFPRDATGEPQYNQPLEPKPISRITARDSAWAINILSFPAGLIKVQDDGDKQARTVTFKRRIRLVGVDDWTNLPDLAIRAKKQVGFYRADRIDFPVRGAWEMEYERTSASEVKPSSAQWILNCVWVVLQSWRPEYPFNYRKPVALTALRIKATHQLNGTLDTFNTLDKRIAPDWDAGSQTWIARVTKNPASGALFALRGPGLYRARPDDEIDFPAFQDWHEFCTAKGLAYNRIHDFEGTLGETLAAIGAAGRAAVKWDGRKWTVVIDRPRDLVVDHVNPRNSSDFRWSPSYFEPPHALRVPFIDETNDYQQAERLVPWPGHVGPIDITEELKLPGKTSPDEIWREARRRQFEIMHRAVGYSAVQQGTARTATTGDLVMASRDVLKRAMHSARVKAVRGDHVETDGVFTMTTGESYAIRFRQFDADDTIGTSVVRTIATVPGESAAVRLTGSGEKPKAGALIHFGPAVFDSIPLIISGITRGKNNSTVLAMLPAAPTIDELTDAEVPPAWSGRVGAEIDLSQIKPAVPVFTGIDSGTAETGDANGLVVGLADGPSGAIVVVAFKLQHRLAGALAWQPPLTCTPAEGSIDVPGYQFDDEVELQAWAVSVAGVESDLTDIVSVTIGSDDFVPTIPNNSNLLLLF